MGTQSHAFVFLKLNFNFFVAATHIMLFKRRLVGLIFFEHRIDGVVLPGVPLIVAY